jgi:hypothetical protein
MGPIGCPETSVRNYHNSLRNSPEERSSHPRRGVSLTSRLPSSSSPLSRASTVVISRDPSCSWVFKFSPYNFLFETSRQQGTLRQVRFLQAVFSRPRNVMYLRAMRCTPGIAVRRSYRNSVWMPAAVPHQITAQHTHTARNICASVYWIAYVLTVAVGVLVLYNKYRYWIYERTVRNKPP